MSNQTHPEIPNGNGGYERQDISVAGVLYFLGGLAAAGLISYFVVMGVYSYLEKRSDAEQAPVNPLVTNAPVDTRKLSVDYKDYLKQNFPRPQLEIDERTQLDKIRREEEETLNSYSYVDKNAGTVRIPIDRAMDLIAQRGLPVFGQPNLDVSLSPAPAPGAPAQQKKAKK